MKVPMNVQFLIWVSALTGPSTLNKYLFIFLLSPEPHELANSRMAYTFCHLTPSLVLICQFVLVHVIGNDILDRNTF